MKTTDFTVGQTLFIRSRYGARLLLEVAVTNIGRRWVTLGYGRHADRFDPTEGRALDGGDYSPPGDVWLSREEFETWKAGERLWTAVRDTMVRRRSFPLGFPLPALVAFGGALDAFEAAEEVEKC